MTSVRDDDVLFSEKLSISPIYNAGHTSSNGEGVLEIGTKRRERVDISCLVC